MIAIDTNALMRFLIRDDAAQVRGLSRSAFIAEAAQNEIQGW